MKRSIYFVLLAVILGLFFIFSASSGMAADKVILKLAHADSTDAKVSRKQAMCEAFANEVNSKSGGRIEVQIFGAGALGGEREYVEAIKAGLVQAGVASGVVANFYPDAMVTDIPYLFPSAKIAWAVLDGPFGKELSEGFYKSTGIRNLAFGEVGFRNFTSGNKPIHSPSDLKGMKIRVMETPFYITMMKALGAGPTPVAWPETYGALQTGVVDGHENVIGSIVAAKIFEVQKFVTLDGHVYGVDWFLMNDKFYKGLSPDLQKIVSDAAQNACDVERHVSQTITEEGIKTLKEHGVEVYTPTAQEMAEFKEATQKPCIDWLKTKVDQKLIDQAFAAVKAAEVQAGQAKSQ